MFSDHNGIKLDTKKKKDTWEMLKHLEIKENMDQRSNLKESSKSILTE